jgi:hypothetical protein
MRVTSVTLRFRECGKQIISKQVERTWSSSLLWMVDEDNMQDLVGVETRLI